MKRRIQMVFEVAAVLLLLGAIVLLATRYSSLPESIHTPINGGGDAHGMGDRIQLWLVVVIGGWIYVLMSLFDLAPVEWMNVPSSVTPETRKRWLQTAKMSMACFKACLMGGLLAWLWRIIAHAAG